MNRLRVLALPLLSALLLTLVACAAPASSMAGNAPPPAAGVPAAIAGAPQLDTRCRTDSDCAVKNVGSCCGYQPACVNAAAPVDPAAVQADCARRGIAGVCGFVEIQSCACVASRCEAADGGRLLR